jgi:hypothetical protein
MESKDYTKAFNAYRTANLARTYTAKELKRELKDVVPYTTSSSFISTFEKYHIIERIQGKVRFVYNPKNPDTKFVYKEKLNNALGFLRKKQKEYQDKYEGVLSPIDKAIKLLLSTGKYEIYELKEVKTIERVKVC